ncbi:MAG: phospholipid carrier-dependent glycosyltransferase [Chloroflexi bacterium]|nr:phospholipid carrier-dependent glycosyltransferase [Chloroflexota bacterium]
MIAVGLRRHWPLGLVMIAAAGLRFWQLGAPALIGDEAYYWLWSQRLAPSYYDHPAGVALLIRTSTALGGNGEAGIRWLNAALGLGAVALAYLLTSRVASSRAAWVAAAALAVAAPYLVVSRYVYTDALHLFLLMLVSLLLLPLLRGAEPAPPPQRYLLIGLAMAAFFNTKYGAYLYALAVLGLIAIARPQLLREARAWLAIAIALGGLLPTVLWNAQHDWASFRWQLSHFAGGAIQRASPLGIVYHALGYLTPPVALLAGLGLVGLGRVEMRPLLVPGLVLVVPVLLSPANSPRNLTSGLALFIVAGAGVLWPKGRQPRRTLGSAVAGLLLISMAVYGVGTVVATQRETHLPQATIAADLRAEASGWKHARQLDLPAEDALFTLDYSVAGQLTCYLGRPVWTAWGQYRIWGIPPLDPATFLSLSYVDLDMVSERLGQAYDRVAPRREIRLEDEPAAKVLHVWRASGLRVQPVTVLELLDFRGLVTGGGDG